MASRGQQLPVDGAGTRTSARTRTAPPAPAQLGLSSADAADSPPPACPRRSPSPPIPSAADRPALSVPVPSSQFSARRPIGPLQINAGQLHLFNRSGRAPSMRSKASRIVLQLDVAKPASCSKAAVKSQSSRPLRAPAPELAMLAARQLHRLKQSGQASLRRSTSTTLGHVADRVVWHSGTVAGPIGTLIARSSSGIASRSCPPYTKPS